MNAHSLFIPKFTFLVSPSTDIIIDILKCTAMYLPSTLLV